MLNSLLNLQVLCSQSGGKEVKGLPGQRGRAMYTATRQVTGYNISWCSEATKGFELVILTQLRPQQVCCLDNIASNGHRVKLN